MFKIFIQSDTPGEVIQLTLEQSSCVCTSVYQQFKDYLNFLFHFCNDSDFQIDFSLFWKSCNALHTTLYALGFSIDKELEDKFRFVIEFIKNNPDFIGLGA